MKAEELMVGDWVIMENTLYEYEQITSAAVYLISCKPDNSYKPIPITPEILEKNGFKKDMYSTLDLGNDRLLEYYHYEHRLRLWVSGIDEWDNHSWTKNLIFQCYATYVHELQHALRLAGIKKEIVL